MKLYDGRIEYNENLGCYGIIGLNGNWIKERLEDGDRIDILIGNVFLATKFGDGPYHPTLNPLPLDNRDFLSGKPAVYYDFENKPSKPACTKGAEKRSRLKLAINAVLISVSVSALLAAMFAGISTANGNSFIGMFNVAFPFCYCFFGGSCIIDAFLLIATNIPVHYATGYGSVFYYGTFLLAVFLAKYFNMDDFQLAFALSAVIVGEACYIFWLKTKKE